MDMPLCLDKLLSEIGGQHIFSTTWMAIDLDSFHPLFDPSPDREIRQYLFSKNKTLSIAPFICRRFSSPS